MSATSEQVALAERYIARTLATLETDTGMLVNGISICDVDVTGIADNRQQLSRRVVIDLKPLPGTRWDQ